MPAVEARPVPFDTASAPALARACLACLDLTALGEDDDSQRIAALCASAMSPFGAPAAVCVYPEWIAFARERLDALGLRSVAVATVVNFPDGDATPAQAARECRRARAAGAAEIDLVIPWRALRIGDYDGPSRLLRECRAACPDRLLKVILESGELADPTLIARASRIALAAGADFLKTSTGKASVHATPLAAAAMLGCIAEFGRGGFKASGGLRRIGDALPYFQLAAEMLGEHWVTPAHFRLGASTLLDDLSAVLGSTVDRHAAPG